MQYFTKSSERISKGFSFITNKGGSLSVSVAKEDEFCVMLKKNFLKILLIVQVKGIEELIYKNFVPNALFAAFVLRSHWL